MVALAIPVTPERSCRTAVIFPFITTGLAIVCAAVPLACLSSLTVLSVALRGNDHHFADSRLAVAQPPLRSAPRNDTTASIPSVPDGLKRVAQPTSIESRPSTRLLLRNIHRNDATASIASVSHGLQQGIQVIRFDVPTLAPMAFTQFCMNYPGDCKSKGSAFAGGRIELDKTRWSELENVNRTVNSSISPQRNENGLAGERWLLSPLRGDCNDYAVQSVTN